MVIDTPILCRNMSPTMVFNALGIGGVRLEAVLERKQKMDLRS